MEFKSLKLPFFKNCLAKSAISSHLTFNGAKPTANISECIAKNAITLLNNVLVFLDDDLDDNDDDGDDGVVIFVCGAS